MRYHFMLLSGGTRMGLVAHYTPVQGNGIVSYLTYTMCHRVQSAHIIITDQATPDQSRPAHPIDTPNKKQKEHINRISHSSTYPLARFATFLFSRRACVCVCVCYIFNFARLATQPKRRNKANTPRQKYSGKQKTINLV